MIKKEKDQRLRVAVVNYVESVMRTLLFFQGRADYLNLRRLVAAWISDEGIEMVISGMVEKGEIKQYSIGSKRYWVERRDTNGRIEDSD